MQKRNKRLQELIRDNKIILQKQCYKHISNTNKDFFNNIFELKKQYSIVDFKLINLNFYFNKSLKKFKN